jgi:acetolactate synthase-1/2/3 large subunit
VTTIADHIARRIRDTGARHAFGIPGGEVLALMDALDRAGIAFHLVKHETAGGFMADAVAQLARTPGVLVGTIGPGVRTS